MSARHSLSGRVFATVFFVAALVILVFTVAGAMLIQHMLAEQLRGELRRETSIVAEALNGADDQAAMLRRFQREGMRITLVDADGTVLYDNDASPALLPSHADRPEIEQALASGTGSAERSSTTLGEVMLYEAVRLDNGCVVRLAQSQAGYLSVLATLVGPLLIVAAVGAVVSLAAARHEARAIIAPLLTVDLDHPKRNVEHAYAEMVPMLERIESQRQDLKRQMRVLADTDRMRREFTANITHELKTPLTTVSGYAELIANGMVTDEADLRDFGGRIYAEAGRLTALVNDILTLSNLDEAERSDSADALARIGSIEPIDLARLLDSVAQRLEHVARKSEVELKLDTAPALITGVQRLVDELAYNLASNAIRYNRAGGSAVLACGVEDGVPYLSVSDTGIGIAADEQDKVFERFYRVDKSRSKARGGTGLGLAIVKHAAAFHHAQIELRSEPGRGTAITVRFPAPADDGVPNPA